MQRNTPQSFWHKLKKPIIGLAPIDGVSDHPFRTIVKKYGNPSVMFTEFVNVEGLCNNATTILKSLYYTDAERPLVAQVFGKTPDNFYAVAVLLSEMGFDGIDINMGCPARKVVQHGSGADLISKPELAGKIIEAVHRGINDYQQGLRIKKIDMFSNKFVSVVDKLSLNTKAMIKDKRIALSVKTRLGVDKPQIDDWISLIAEQSIDALTLHGRTLKQAFSGRADWDLIGQACELIKKKTDGKLIFLGNGDVKNAKQAINLSKKYRTDGALIARASFGNPQAFSIQDREVDNLKIAAEHAKLYEKYSRELLDLGLVRKQSFLPMRKHLAWYVKGFPNAANMRKQLVETSNSQEVNKILKSQDIIN